MCLQDISWSLEGLEITVVFGDEKSQDQEVPESEMCYQMIIPGSS